MLWMKAARVRDCADCVGGGRGSRQLPAWYYCVPLCEAATVCPWHGPTEWLIHSQILDICRPRWSDNWIIDLRIFRQTYFFLTISWQSPIYNPKSGEPADASLSQYGTIQEHFQCADVVLKRRCKLLSFFTIIFPGFLYDLVYAYQITSERVHSRQSHDVITPWIRWWYAVIRRDNWQRLSGLALALHQLSPALVSAQ